MMGVIYVVTIAGSLLVPLVLLLGDSSHRAGALLLLIVIDLPSCFVDFELLHL